MKNPVIGTLYSFAIPGTISISTKAKLRLEQEYFKDNLAHNSSVYFLIRFFIKIFLVCV
jgi:hypothetical protein